MMGAGTSFLELMEQTEEVEKSWGSYRSQNSITVDSCPKKGPYRYEAQYMKYIADKHKSYKIWDHYKYCKQFRNKMVTMRIYQEWNEFVETWCDFLSKENDPQRISKRLYDALMFVAEGFSKSLDETVLARLTLEILAACIPVDTAQPGHEKWTGFRFHSKTQIYYNLHQEARECNSIYP